MKPKITIFLATFAFVLPATALAFASPDILSEYLGMSNYINGEITAPHCIPYGTRQKDSCQFGGAIFYTPAATTSVASVQFVFNQLNSDVSDIVARIQDASSRAVIATSTPLAVSAYPYQVQEGKNIVFTFSNQPPLTIGHRYFISTYWHDFQDHSLILFAPYNALAQSIALHVLRGALPATSTPVSLTNPAETEDDGNQDAKGVADKTKFTFGVTVDGATSDSVKVIATSTADTFILNLAPNGDIYTATSTFPKGHYTYHFEVSAGGQITKTADQHFTTGYSNVVFLPGLEASRLYKPDYAGGTDDLWEPYGDANGASLGLDSDGKSVRNDIYTKDVIDNAYVPIVGNVYKSFLEQLDAMKNTEHTIVDYSVIPYDWRLSLDEILSNGTKFPDGRLYYAGELAATSTPYIIQELSRLAESSDTGKVTIVAHSNGGLVAKALTGKLGMDAPKLIDQMIFVAVPQAGTPKAIGAILHGFEQELPTSWFDKALSAQAARTLAQNMPSAYNLLPSSQYFTYTDDAVITFDSSDFLDPWRRKYGDTLYPNIIHSSERLHNFLADTSRVPMPVSEETKNPLIGNETLLDRAELLHSTLDNWTPPEGIALTEIAGWGEETVATIEYYQGWKTECSDPSDIYTCRDVPALEYKPKMVLDGDGTVVVPSALWTAASTGAGKYWVDLKSYGESGFLNNTINRKHADILEVPKLLEFLKNIVTRKGSALPLYISTSAPVNPDTETRLHFTLHSPLTLDLYDSLGNHTGISPTTGFLEENIPGSRYLTFGEVKYIGAPASTTLRLSMRGYAVGSFTLDVEKAEGETVIASTTFAGIPSGASTVATMNIPIGGNIPDMSPLVVDENGDGAIDLSLMPKEGGIVTLPKPIFTVTANNQAITLGSPLPPLTASFSPAVNDVIGVPSCTTIATGNTVGTHLITCTIGTLTSNTYDFAFATGTLTVSYRFDGFLQPINDIAYHATQAPSVFKGGSTVPVKFQIKKFDSTPVQANTLPAFSFQKGNAMSASVDESTYSDTATTGSTFKWDSTTQQYIYNWSTKGIAPGYWYKLSAKLDDGKMYSVVVGLR